MNNDQIVSKLKEISSDLSWAQSPEAISSLCITSASGKLRELIKELENKE